MQEKELDIFDDNDWDDSHLSQLHEFWLIEDLIKKNRVVIFDGDRARKILCVDDNILGRIQITLEK